MPSPSTLSGSPSSPQAVMHNLRAYIRKERGVGAKNASISGYWRRGRTEETFRQWKRELAEAEAAEGTTA